MNNQQQPNRAFLPHLRSFEGNDAQVASQSPAEGPFGNEVASRSGKLIINADDWGRDQETTTRILGCLARGSISSVSAMVFMADSERAAVVAREQGIDAGLHLNLTHPLSADNCWRELTDRQHEVATYLLRHKSSRFLFNPALARSFEYVVSAQIEEYGRLYGMPPGRLDGHHHMHLCANILFGRLIPQGIVVRRNFSFSRGEKSWPNRCYRGIIDNLLARRHRLTDFFFSLAPLDPPDRLQRILSLSRNFAVEVETHPIKPEEFRFLESGKIFRLADNLCIAKGYSI